MARATPLQKPYGTIQTRRSGSRPRLQIHFEAGDPTAVVEWRGRPRFKNPMALFKNARSEADRGFNNDLAGDSGFGRPVKRGTRFKYPLKPSGTGRASDAELGPRPPSDPTSMLSYNRKHSFPRVKRNTSQNIQLLCCYDAEHTFFRNQCRLGSFFLSK